MRLTTVIPSILVLALTSCAQLDPASPQFLLNFNKDSVASTPTESSLNSYSKETDDRSPRFSLMPPVGLDSNVPELKGSHYEHTTANPNQEVIGISSHMTETAPSTLAKYWTHLLALSLVGAVVVFTVKWRNALN